MHKVSVAAKLLVALFIAGCQAAASPPQPTTTIQPPTETPVLPTSAATIVLSITPTATFHPSSTPTAAVPPAPTASATPTVISTLVLPTIRETQAQFIRRVVSETLVSYPVELRVTESEMAIPGVELKYVLISIDTKGSAPFVLPKKAGLEDPEVNKKAFSAIRDFFPGIAKVTEMYDIRELAGEFGPRVRRYFDQAKWTDVSLNSRRDEYFKYISPDGTVLVKFDGDAIRTNIRYWDNPYRFLWNTGGNPVTNMPESEYYRIIGDRLPAVQSILSIK